MRWLFGILLLANLIFFLWDFTEQPARSGTPAPLAATVAGVAPLVLVGERNALAENPTPIAQTPPSPEPETDIQPATAKPETKETETAEAAVEAVLQPTQPEPEPEPIAEPEPTPEPAVPVAIAADCTRLGPFSEEGSARAATRFLASRNIYATVTTEGEARDARFIVYLPAANSRAAALERLRELQAKGIDSFVMGGAFSNAISLGVFSQQESAQRLVTQMEKRGYAVKIYSQERESATHWLELGPKNSGRMTTDLVATLAKRYPEAQYEARSCP